MIQTKDVIIFTGAGVSVASGLGTFRGSAQALWEQFDVNVVCNMKTFHKNRPKVFEFYNMRKEQYCDVQPNTAHHVIAEVLKATRGRLFTSNVDMLHEAAGSKAIHVHGQMDEMLCISCGHRWNIGNALFDEHGECPMCESKDIKPGIVLFGESAPRYADLGAAVNTDSIKIVIGTSLNVLNPFSLGYGHGKLILVDPEVDESDATFFDEVISKKAEDLTVEELLAVIAKHS